MARTICILQGHPHGGGAHFCHALADAYAEGAARGGAALETIDVAECAPPCLLDPADFETPPPEAIREAQEKITRADHLITIYPLWLGTMPALVKAFFEQLARNEFALSTREKGWPRKMLKGRSARVVVTMGMPATAYRLFLGAHGVKSFESGVLGMAGFKPVRETLIGGVGGMKPRDSERWLGRMRRIGELEARR